jgi:hypothetical protein
MNVGARNHDDNALKDGVGSASTFVMCRVVYPGADRKKTTECVVIGTRERLLGGVNASIAGANERDK